MTEGDLNAHDGKAIAVFLNGEAITEPTARGDRLVDASFLLLFNASLHEVSFTIPERPYNGPWEIVLDTYAPQRNARVTTNHPVQIQPYSLCLMRQVP